ncbi:MAG: hypothetical protein ACM3UP_01570 [Methanocella sp.]
MARQHGRWGTQARPNNRRTFGPSRRILSRPDWETTAPDHLIQRIGAEGTEINAAPLKPEMVEDGADTKD